MLKAVLLGGNLVDWMVERKAVRKDNRWVVEMAGQLADQMEKLMVDEKAPMSVGMMVVMTDD